MSKKTEIRNRVILGRYFIITYLCFLQQLWASYQQLTQGKLIDDPKFFGEEIRL